MSCKAIDLYRWSKSAKEVKVELIPCGGEIREEVKVELIPCRGGSERRSRLSLFLAEEDQRGGEG